MTRLEIAKRAGISVRQVDHLSRLAKWDTVSIEQCYRFSAACGVDILKPHRDIEWLIRRKKVSWKPIERVVAVGLKTIRAYHQPKPL